MNTSTKPFNWECQGAMGEFWKHVVWLWKNKFVPENIRQQCFKASDGEQLSEALSNRTRDEQEFLLGCLEHELQARKGGVNE